MSKTNYVLSRGSVTVGELRLGNVPKLVIDGKIVRFSTENMSEGNLQLFKSVMDSNESGLAVGFHYKSNAAAGRGVSFKASGKLHNDPFIFHGDDWQTLDFTLSIETIEFILEPETQT